MARSIKLNVDYFPHYISRGKKMRSVVKRYGNDGRATWWTLLEELALADHHYLDLRSEMDFSLIADECDVDEDRLVEIIDHLVKFNVFDKELWSHRIVRSQELIDSVEDVWSRRQINCMTKEEVISKLIAPTFTEEAKSVDLSHTLTPEQQSIPTSTEKKPVRRKNDKQEDFELVFPFNTEQFINAWEAYKEYRRVEHGFKYRSKKTEQTALNSIVTDGGDTEEIAIAMIMKAISKGWKGIFKLNEDDRKRINGIGTNSTGSGSRSGVHGTGVSNDYIEQIARDLAES